MYPQRGLRTWVYSSSYPADPPHRWFGDKLRPCRRAPGDTAVVSEWRVGWQLWPGQQAAGQVEVDRAAGGHAGVDPVRLLPVPAVQHGGGGAVGVDLARVVQRATLAALVGGVVDADELTGSDADHGRAGGAGDGAAA